MDRFRDLSLEDGKSTTEVLDGFKEQVAEYRDQVAQGVRFPSAAAPPLP